MDSFAIRPTTWPVLRVFSRNPLMRKTDRIEAATIPLAVFLVIVAAACAGVLGTLAHDIESRKYLEEAKARHTVTARAVEDSSTSATFPGPGTSKVVVRWRANDVDHTKLLDWDRSVKSNAPLQIWVGTNGNQVDAPTPPALAGANAGPCRSCRLVDPVRDCITEPRRCSKPSGTRCGMLGGRTDAC